MPRPPSFTVLTEKGVKGEHESSVNSPGMVSGIVPDSGLSFPVICKPVEACGES